MAGKQKKNPPPAPKKRSKTRTPFVPPKPSLEGRKERTPSSSSKPKVEGSKNARGSYGKQQRRMAISTDEIKAGAVPMVKDAPRYKFQKFGSAARAMYVNEQLSAAEIRRRLNNQVSFQTILKWAREYGWDKEREELSAGFQSHIRDMQAVMNLAMKKVREGLAKNELPSDQVMGKISSILKQLKDMSGDMYFETNLVTMVNGLINFCQLNDPDYLERFSKIVHGFSVSVLTARNS